MLCVTSQTLYDRIGCRVRDPLYLHRLMDRMLILRVAYKIARNRKERPFKLCTINVQIAMSLSTVDKHGQSNHFSIKARIKAFFYGCPGERIFSIKLDIKSPSASKLL